MDWGSCLDKSKDSATGVATLNCIPALFTSFFNAAVMLVGTVTVIMIILGGMKYIRSKGDAKQKDEARKILTYAIFGMLVILFSFMFLRIIAAVTGVNCFLGFGATSCK